MADPAANREPLNGMRVQYLGVHNFPPRPLTFTGQALVVPEKTQGGSPFPGLIRQHSDPGRHLGCRCAEIAEIGGVHGREGNQLEIGQRFPLQVIPPAGPGKATPPSRADSMALGVVLPYAQGEQLSTGLGGHHPQVMLAGRNRRSAQDVEEGPVLGGHFPGVRC